MRDIRYALRCLRNSPGFAAAAILMLALGIGANTAIFSVVESVLLRPLPYKDPASLVQLWNTYPPAMPQAPNSAGDFRDFRERAQTFSGLAAYIDTPRSLNLTGEGEPARLEMRYATSGLFPMLERRAHGARRNRHRYRLRVRADQVARSFIVWSDRHRSPDFWGSGAAAGGRCAVRLLSACAASHADRSCGRAPARLLNCCRYNPTVGWNTPFTGW